MRDLTGPVTHRDLIVIARHVRGAAASDDTRRLHSELARLRAALTEHLTTENEDFDGVPDSVGRIVRDGQRRLLRLLDDVLFDSVDTDRDCNCLVRAVEIEVALRRQARLEAALRPGIWR